MEDNKNEAKMNIIEFTEIPLSDTVGDIQESEEIRIYVPPKRGSSWRKSLFRFAILTSLFTLAFMLLLEVYDRRQPPATEVADQYLSNTSTSEETAEDVAYDEIDEALIPLVINESKVEVELNNNEEYSLNHLVESSSGVKILIVHSHNSESVSQTSSVTDAGEVISQILTSAGIGTYHCTNDHDSDSNIGAYSRMKASVADLIDTYPDAVCVIDIHDSDSGLPITFTVGTDSAGWNENLLLSKAVCARISDAETALRLLPGALGQDSGLLTLNIGIGGKSFSDEDTRGLIASVSEAIIKICNEKASVS